jgi:hypothetical protein
MADSEFERFKKMFPGGKKDMNIKAIPAPLPGPGGIARAVVGKGVQSGVRRFSDVAKGDKTTKMKTRQGTERKDPMEPRVVDSGRSKALEKTRRGDSGPTKMKDRKGLEIKQTERKSAAPPSRMSTGKKAAIAGGAGVVVGSMAGIEMAKRMKARSAAARDRVESNQSVQRSSYSQTNPTQRPYDASKSPASLDREKPVKPKLRPAKEAKKQVRKQAPKKAKAAPKKAEKPKFKGNWKNAAPTPMQARAGMRRKK